MLWLSWLVCGTLILLNVILAAWNLRQSRMWFRRNQTWLDTVRLREGGINHLSSHGRDIDGESYLWRSPSPHIRSGPLL